MSAPDGPCDSVVWDSERQRYRWTAVLPTRTGTGTAETEAGAWQCVADWHEQQPYRVVRLLPRGGIEPPATP